MKTVAIHHPHDPKRPTVISEDLYDPAVHELWSEPEAAEPAVIDAEEDDDDGD